MQLVQWKFLTWKWCSAMVSFTAKRSHQNLKTTLPKTTTLLTSTHAAPIDKMSLQALITVSKEIFPCLKNTNTVEKFVQVLQYLCIWWIHGKKNNVFFHLNHSKHQFIGKFFIILLDNRLSKSILSSSWMSQIWQLSLLHILDISPGHPVTLCTLSGPTTFAFCTPEAFNSHPAPIPKIDNHW